MKTFSFVVEDRPAPQGSKAHLGNGVMVESSRHVKPWREAVKQAASDRKEQTGADDGTYFWRDTPLSLHIRFWHRRPKSHYRTGKHSTELKPGIPSHVPTRPDASKLVRSTEDAVTAAGIWHDDAQVAVIHCHQFYSDTGFEGAEINIQEIPQI